MPIEVNGKSLEVDEEGYLSNLNDWEPGVAEVMSKEDERVLRRVSNCSGRTCFDQGSRQEAG